MSVMPEMTLPDLVDDLVAVRHAGGYRFKVPERVLRHSRTTARGKATGRVDHQGCGRGVPLRPSPAHVNGAA